jgi:hypothetical protein
MILHFPPKGSTWYQVIQSQQLQIELEREQILNLAIESLHSTSTAIYHLSIALLTMNHQDRVHKGNQEVGS